MLLCQNKTQSFMSGHKLLHMLNVICYWVMKRPDIIAMKFYNKVINQEVRTKVSSCLDFIVNYTDENNMLWMDYICSQCYTNHVRFNKQYRKKEICNMLFILNIFNLTKMKQNNTFQSNGESLLKITIQRQREPYLNRDYCCSQCFLY